MVKGLFALMNFFVELLTLFGSALGLLSQYDQLMISTGWVPFRTRWSLAAW